MKNSPVRVPRKPQFPWPCPQRRIEVPPGAEGSPSRESATQALRGLLAKPGLQVMPCCFDALSAQLIERAGFPVTFMSGFAVSATRLAQPDTGLISYGEMLDQGRNICAAVSIPVIGDADTGYGNPINVRRTIEGYAAAGFASAMIEDQLAPKRCGHTRGKQVVGRDEALARVRAAVDAREAGADLLVLARTDARGPEGLDEALWRARAFEDLGADFIFVEAPASEAEMEAVCRATRVPNLANMVEEGVTPLLSPERLEALGYRLAAYPLTLLSAAVRAMEEALVDLAEGRPVERRLSFEALRERVGFEAYEALSARYATED